MASYRNNSVENRSIYQMNDNNISFTVQAPPTPVHNNNNNNNLYKQEASSPHNNQNLRFHLQSHNQQIQTSNFHILSRHYLGQQQQHQHFQYQHHATRQHHMMNMNLTSNIPLNASESLRTHIENVIDVRGIFFLIPSLFIKNIFSSQKTLLTRTNLLMNKIISVYFPPTPHTKA